MKSILVVNVNWVGDVILSSPIFTALKETYPQARVSCLAVPRVKEILESIPGVDEVILYDEQGVHKTPAAKLRLIFELARRHFDIAFLLHRSWTRAFLVFLAGIPRRVGYDTKGRGWLLTHKVSPLDSGAHRLDHYLHVLESFGVKVKNRQSSLVVFDQARDEIQAVLEKHGVAEEDFLVVINPVGNWNLKRWPARNFTLLIDRLTAQEKVKVVLCAAPADTAEVQEIEASVQRRVINLAGQTTFKQLVALLQRAHLVISADSGPLHIAHSVGTDVIGLWGPTRPEVTGPRGRGRAWILQHDVGCNRRPCYYLQCPDNVCMQAVTVEEVFDAVETIRNP